MKRLDWFWIIFLGFVLQSKLGAEVGFTLHPVLRTGEQTPSGDRVTSVGWGAGINDAGQLAFTVGLANGRSAVLVGDHEGLEIRSDRAQTIRPGFG